MAENKIAQAEIQPRLTPSPTIPPPPRKFSPAKVADDLITKGIAEAKSKLN